MKTLKQTDAEKVPDNPFGKNNFVKIYDIKKGYILSIIILKDVKKKQKVPLKLEFELMGVKLPQIGTEEYDFAETKLKQYLMGKIVKVDIIKDIGKFYGIVYLENDISFNSFFKTEGHGSLK